MSIKDKYESKPGTYTENQVPVSKAEDKYFFNILLPAKTISDYKQMQAPQIE